MYLCLIVRIKHIIIFSFTLIVKNNGDSVLSLLSSIKNDSNIDNDDDNKDDDNNNTNTDNNKNDINDNNNKYKL